MFRLFQILLVLCLAWSATADAQSISGLDTGTASPTPALDAQSSKVLTDFLRNDAAREALIQALEDRQGSAAPQADPETSAEPAPENLVTAAEEAVVQLPVSVGRRAAELTRETAGMLANEAVRVWTELQRLPSRFSRLDDAVDPAIIMRALTQLAVIIAVTYAVFVTLRLLARLAQTRINAAARDAGLIRILILNAVSIVLDALTVAISWGAGYVAAATSVGTFGEVGLFQSLYLNAFLVAEMAKVVLRAVLSPHYPNLRHINLPDEGARSIWLWSRISVTIVVYIELLMVPIISNQVGRFASLSLSTASSTLVVLLTLAYVIRRRKDFVLWVTNKQKGEAEEATNQMMRAILAYWHWPIIGYLLFLLVTVLTRPGSVLIPLLVATAQVAAAIVVGMILTSLLAARARKGIKLPAMLTDRLPMLEGRLNSTIPQMLTLMRLVVIAVVTAVVLNIFGWIHLENWMESDAGSSFTTSLWSAVLILGFVFVLWLGFASWVDYRLNPYFGRAPTARETTLLSLLRNAVTIILAILTLMLVMSEIGLDIAPLLASAGVLGLAIGFGAQKLVQDIITGIFIQFENAINVGDVVSVGGITGSVEKLTVRSVSLRDVEGIFHIVPFSSVDLVSNYTRNFSYYLCDMGVAYREDIAVAKQAMHDAFDELRKDPEQARSILGSLEWFGLNSFGDSAIVLRARIKTLPGMQWGIGRAYNLILKDLFDARGIEIPFPHQTIYFGEDRDGRAPPIHVRSAPEKPAAQTVETEAVAAEGGVDLDKRITASTVPGDPNMDDR